VQEAEVKVADGAKAKKQLRMIEPEDEDNVVCALHCTRKCAGAAGAEKASHPKLVGPMEHHGRPKSPTVFLTDVPCMTSALRT
jgi:hypothetical protein